MCRADTKEPVFLCDALSQGREICNYSKSLLYKKKYVLYDTFKTKIVFSSGYCASLCIDNVAAQKSGALNQLTVRERRHPGSEN